MIYTNTAKRQRCKGCASAPDELLDARWWLPGVVVVEFKQRISPDRIFDFEETTYDQTQTDHSWVDFEKFRHIAGPLLVKPPKWTFQFEYGKPPSKRRYERFITLYLQPDADIPHIAAELGRVRGVAHAAPEPVLSPPIPRIPFHESNTVFKAPHLNTLSAAPLLNEPLAVSGGEPLGLDVTVGFEQLKNQWYLFRSRADGVLNSGTNGAGVVVAIVDWGFNVDHVEFQNRIAYSYNAAQDNGNVSSGPKKWHGTATLGLIGAGDNNAGMLGFAAGAELWAIQGQDAGANLDNQSWIKAIDHAREKSSGNKPKIILVEASTNRGFNIESSPSLLEAIKSAIEDNCVVVVPAGNRGGDAGKGQSNVSIRPSGSILVGATQYDPDPAIIKGGATNWGPRVVVSAPGEITTDVTTCDCSNDSYRNDFGGTSGAAAKVAGAMALVLQTFPEVTHQQLVEILKTRMPQITTASHPMGCFLDVAELMTQVEIFLSEL